MSDQEKHKLPLAGTGIVLERKGTFALVFCEQCLLYICFIIELLLVQTMIRSH